MRGKVVAMVPIPHGAGAWLAGHAGPLVALAVSLAGGWLGRRRAAGLPVVGAAALLAGWGVMLGGAALPRAVWAPHRGAEVLLGVAAASLAVAAAMAWRGTKNRRLLLGVDAVFAGWWVAHAGVSDADFWRVGFAVTVMSVWLGRVVRDEAAQGLAAALSLWAGLFAVQAGPVWLAAAAVASAGWAGMLAAGRGGLLPAAPMAALLGAADLAGGRALRGRVDGTDLACLAALSAPLVAKFVGAKLVGFKLGGGKVGGGKSGRLAAVLAAVATAFGLAAVVWLVRRATSS